MADGSSDDDLDWFERALRDRADSMTEDGGVDEVESAEDEPSGAGPGGTETSGDSGSEDGDSSEPDSASGASATMDEIASAFDLESGDRSDGPSEETQRSFGFDVNTAGGPGDSFGFGVSQEYDSFKEEEYHTDVPRIDVGIDGLDEMIQGGIPERALMVAIGGAGTGKTTFGLQFLNEALENGERGVFITLEESHDRILQSAKEKGWPFDEYEADGSLAVIDLDPVDMANSLVSIRNELPRLVEEFGASRLVLDSVSLLEMMYDDQATRRTEIYDFARALKAAGVTTMLTSENEADNPFASRYGVIEYLTDAVFILRYVRPEDFRETRLAIEIQKIRDANHSRETKPYEITSTGISVYRQANIF